MATAAWPFEKGERVTIGANSNGVPTGAGFVVDVVNDLDGTGWVVTVRVADDLRGTVDYKIDSAALT